MAGIANHSISCNQAGNNAQEMIFSRHGTRLASESSVTNNETQGHRYSKRDKRGNKHFVSCWRWHRRGEKRASGQGVKRFRKTHKDEGSNAICATDKQKKNSCKRKCHQN